MSPAARPTILIVEDDPVVAQLEQARLEGARYGVVIAPSAAEALEQMGRRFFDVVVLDYRLPGGDDGLVLMAKMKAAGFDIPVILVTGNSSEALAVQALRAGARDLISKSADYLDYLLEALERVLKQRLTERRFAESEARLTSIIDSNKDAIIISESDHRISLFNKAAERMFGLPAEQALGHPIAQFIQRTVGEPATESEGPVTALLHEGSVGIRTDGSEFPVELSLSRAQVGGRLFHTVIVRDITSRLRNEQAIRESDRFARSTLDGLSAHIAIIDEAGTILAVNKAWREFAEANEPLLSSVCEGANYLEICDRGHGPLAGEGQNLSAGIRAVLSRFIHDFSTEYPCHGPTQRHWFSVRVTPFPGEGPRRVVIAHEDITARKMAENALRESHEFNRQIISSLREGLTVLDEDLRYRLWNGFMAQLSGLPSKAVIGKHPWDVFSFFEETPARAMLDRVLLGETISVPDLFTEPPPPGRAAWVSQILTPLRDVGGRIVGVLGTIHDITPRKSAEEELQRTSMLLRTVASESAEAIFAKDLEGRYLLFNPAAARFVGRPVGEVLGRDDTELFDLKSARTVMERDRHVMETGESEMREERLTAAGKTRIYEAFKAPVRDARGRVVGMVGISRDITEQKQAEEVLSSERTLLRTLIDAMPDIVFTKDADGRFVVANKAALEMVGLSRQEEIEGKTVSDLYPPDVAEAYERDDREALAGRSIFNREETYIDRAGKRRNFLTIKIPLRDASGAVAGLVGIRRDVTAHKLLEEQLHQSQKMEAFGQLAGGVAHDFNNLLTIIIGYSEMILAHLPAADERRNMVADIHHAGERAASLTRQLLAFSRKLVLEPTVLDLNQIVTNIEKMLRRLIGEDIVLTCIVRPVLRVKVDAGQIEQVIINLAVNARDAMPRGGRLTIETTDLVWTEENQEKHPECPPGRYVALTVSDNGLGISPVHLPRIFEPFFTTKDVGKGTGLGLATVFGIVRQSEGFIFVDSEPGRGTTFRILLPAFTESLHDAVAMPGPMPRGGREAILIVEDDATVRGLVRDALEHNGYRVLEADNGAAALAAFDAARGQIDLLVTDVVMPVMSGRELADALLQTKPSLRVLFVSGYTDDAILRHGIVESERAFLQKPFTPSGLAKKVREVLDETPTSRRL